MFTNKASLFLIYSYH